jgi:uncharacterized protein involved in response to NO
MKRSSVKSVLLEKIPAAPVWQLAFRPFFLLASLSSVISLTVWLLFLNSGSVLNQQQVLSPVLWHMHEMFFGFTLLVAVGFLLTAVQNWTGQKSLQGYSLIALTLIWLAIRIVLFLPQEVLSWLLLLQLSWWLIVLYSFARLLIRSNNRRNYIILLLLAKLSILHLAFLYFSQQSLELLIHLGRSAILLFTIVVGIIAGRIIPLFTRNAVALENRLKIKSTDKLDIYLLVISILGWLNFFISYFIQLPISPAPILLIIASLHLLRLFNWGSIYTLNNPLLWSLHFSYLSLALGLIAVAMSFYSQTIRMSDAFHVITLGVFGGMILSMICRVSLGHTGRLLKVNRWIAWALAMIFVAMLIRLVFSMFGQSLWAWNISATIWIACYAIFLKVYFPILTRSHG